MGWLEWTWDGPWMLAGPLTAVDMYPSIGYFADADGCSVGVPHFQYGQGYLFPVSIGKTCRGFLHAVERIRGPQLYPPLLSLESPAPAGTGQASWRFDSKYRALSSRRVSHTLQPSLLALPPSMLRTSSGRRRNRLTCVHRLACRRLAGTDFLASEIQERQADRERGGEGEFGFPSR